MKDIAFLLRLLLAQNRRRPLRAAVGLLGIAVSVCLVAWVVRGYEAALAGGGAALAGGEDRFDFLFSSSPREPGGAGPPGGKAKRGMPPGFSFAPLDPRLVEALLADDDVAEASAVVRSRVRVVEPAPVRDLGPFGGALLVGLEAGAPPQSLARGRWPAAEGEAAMSPGLAERYALALDGSITVGGAGDEASFRIVGILEGAGGGQMPFSPTGGDLYVTSRGAAKVNGYAGRVNSLSVALKPGRDQADFLKTWSARTAQADPPAAVRSLRRQSADPLADRMSGMIKVQEGNAIVLAFLAACFIIFSTLSAGVRERVRQYATLRAVALTRGQLIFLVFAEGLLLAAAGWALGLLLARGLLGLGNALAGQLSFFRTAAFAGRSLGGTEILASAVCALGGALAAAVLPAWQAARLKPADILGGAGENRPPRFPRLAVALGLFLIVANPLVVLLAGYEPVRRLLAGTYVGGFGPPLLSSAGAIVGLALVTPLVVRLADLVFGPALAWLLRLDRRFLRQQLSANLWRAVGTTVALAAGLSLFVTALVWGYSMLVPFTPDESLPRMLVSVLPAGLPESAVDEVQRTPGVVAGECLPLMVEQPRLTEEMLRSKPFAHVDETQQHLLIMGLDERRALAGDHPLLGLDFVQGDRETAVRQLAAGRACLVPDHFQTQTGLGVGDRFSVELPERPGQSVEYTIAGVVYVPGWHWFTKFSEIRRRSGRALAVIFADYAQVKRDFDLERVSYFWLNAEPAVGFAELEKRLEPVADRHAGVQAQIPGVGPAEVNKQYVRITEREDLIERLFRRADSVIWALTRLPLMILLLAALAVFNAVVAAVRARFWQFGILRGVGLTRGQLFRLVLSESLLLFGAAGALSLFAGVLLAWCGTHLCTYFFYFGGMTPPLVLPWGGLALGYALALAICLAAGLAAAAQAALREPLSFIQGGRLAGW